MKKGLVLIDGMNFAFRATFSKRLTNNGIPTHIVYGFFKNLIDLSNRLEEARYNNGVDYENDYVVCWEGGYSDRLKISREAIVAGLINKEYKEDRRVRRENATDDEKAESEDMKRQCGVVMEILKHTKITQAVVDGYEGDDVVASYVERYKGKYDRMVLVTSDHDYYQLLDDNVVIYNASKSYFYGKDDFVKEYGISDPRLWVDFGSFVGDVGDTIIGIKGCGEITMLPLVKEFGNIDCVYNGITAIAAPLLKEYGTAGAILDAVNANKIKKLGFKKVCLNILLGRAIVDVAYKLKKMVTDLDVSVGVSSSNRYELENCFRDNGFNFSEKQIIKLLNKVVLDDKLIGILHRVAHINVVEEALTQGELF